MKVQSGNKQAQRRAAAETAAFIRVVRYNDESSFNLDNDFDMNPVSPKTWPHMGPIWVTIWATHMGPIRFLSTCFIWIPCGFPNIVQISAQLVQKGPACVAQLGSQILVISNNARNIVSWTATWQLSVINKTKMSFLFTIKIDYWLKMFLENKNISFIKTIIYPSHDMNKYVLCKGLKIRLYSLYIIDWKTKTNFWNR